MEGVANNFYYRKWGRVQNVWEPLLLNHSLRNAVIEYLPLVTVCLDFLSEYSGFIIYSTLQLI